MERLRRDAPTVLLVAALLASAALLLALTHGLTFFQDTWEFLINRRDLTVDSLLEPHNEQVPVLGALERGIEAADFLD